MAPRFHDTEVLGQACNVPTALTRWEDEGGRVSDADLRNEELTASVRRHLSDNNPERAVNAIAKAHDELSAQHIALSRLRNDTFRSLSRQKGVQSAHSPQALRLQRLTPSIGLRD